MKKLNHLFRSFNARIVQPEMQKHYAKTKYGKTIAQYKNLYQGKRCFFIGNGPSLRAEDLDILNKNHEITFAFNRIYNIFEKTLWRPDFYISQDEKMLLGCVDIVEQLDLPVKFVPVQLHWYYGVEIHDATYFNMRWQQIDVPKDFLFSDDASQELYCANTGMYTAAQLAAYMGFSSIYFIGVDHHFQISQNNKGEIIVDNSARNYFSENYDKDRNDLYIPNVEKSTLTYIAMKMNCDKRGIKVYNATRGGKLEVFPRIDFDQLFKQ